MSVLLKNKSLSSLYVALYYIRSGVASICCEEGQRWKLCHGALLLDLGPVQQLLDDIG